MLSSEDLMVPEVVKAKSKSSPTKRKASASPPQLEGVTRMHDDAGRLY